MNTIASKLLATASLALVLGVSASLAQSISITNSSFESNTGYNGGITSTIVGWTNQTPAYGDVSAVTSSFTSGLTGSNAIWLDGTISQLTAATFTTGATYTLTIDVGNPAGVTTNVNGFQFGFRNAANTGFITGTGQQFINSTTINSIADGTFQAFSVAYTAVVGDNGNSIRIGMTDFTGGGSATYRMDNVRLSASAIPEPSTFSALAGLGVLSLAVTRRRRTT